jgi:hypothetical protein
VISRRPRRRASTAPRPRRRSWASSPRGAHVGRHGAGGESAAVMRKPVCATIRWSGRTARPSTCQPRTMVSEASGSVNRPVPRTYSATRRAAWRWRCSRHHAAGGECLGDRVDALPRREHVQHDPIDVPAENSVGQLLHEIADDDAPGLGSSPRKSPRWRGRRRRSRRDARRRPGVRSVRSLAAGTTTGPRTRHRLRRRSHRGRCRPGSGSAPHPWDTRWPRRAAWT